MHVAAGVEDVAHHDVGRLLCDAAHKHRHRGPRGLKPLGIAWGFHAVAGGGGPLRRLGYCGCVGVGAEWWPCGGGCGDL